MSNIIDNSNCVANFPHKLLTTNRQVSNFCKTFANDLSANRKLSKTELSEIIQSGEFLGRLPVRLMKVSLPSLKNLNTPLTKNVLNTPGLTAAAADTDFEKKVLELSAAKLEIWNEQIEDIIKIAKSLEGSHLLIKDVN